MANNLSELATTRIRELKENDELKGYLPIDSSTFGTKKFDASKIALKTSVSDVDNKFTSRVEELQGEVNATNGVVEDLRTKVEGALIFRGTKTPAEISALVLDEVKVGDFYSVSEDGTVRYRIHDEQVELEVKETDEIAWSSTGWNKLGQDRATDLSDYTKTRDLAEVALSGDYDDLKDKPSIPTNVSDLNNDTGFITANDQAITSKQDAIADLDDIRSGAAAGATAVQPEVLNDYALKSEIPEVPVTDVTIGGTSVVNAQGVAEINLPSVPVTSVTVDGTNVVDAQGVAAIDLTGKEDTIDDLSDIRSGATAGATAVQDVVATINDQETSFVDPNTKKADLSMITDDLAGIKTAVANKVDKVSGKGLSTEDYTTEEQTKLSGIEAGAQVNNIYVCNLGEMSYADDIPASKWDEIVGQLILGKTVIGSITDVNNAEEMYAVCESELNYHWFNSVAEVKTAYPNKGYTQLTFNFETTRYYNPAEVTPKAVDDKKEIIAKIVIDKDNGGKLIYEATQNGAPGYTIELKKPSNSNYLRIIPSWNASGEDADLQILDIMKRGKKLTISEGFAGILNTGTRDISPLYLLKNVTFEVTEVNTETSTHTITIESVCPAYKVSSWSDTLGPLALLYFRMTFTKYNDIFRLNAGPDQQVFYQVMASGGNTGDVLKRTDLNGLEWGSINVPVTNVTVGGTSVLSNGVAVIPAIPTVPVTDVTVGGSSVLTNGTAVIPAIPTASSLAGSGLSEDNGKLTVNTGSGLELSSYGQLKVDYDTNTLTVDSTDGLTVTNPVPATTGASSGDVLTYNGSTIGWAAPQGGDDAVYVDLGNFEVGIPVGQTSKWDEIAEHLVAGESVVGRVTSSNGTLEAPAITQIDFAAFMSAIHASTLAEMKEYWEERGKLDMLTIKFMFEQQGATLRVDVTPDAGTYPRYMMLSSTLEITEVYLNMDVSLRPKNVYIFKIQDNKYVIDTYGSRDLDDDIEELLRVIVSTCDTCKFSGWMGNTPGESTTSKFYGENIPAKIALVDEPESGNTTIQIDVNGVVMKDDSMDTPVPAMWRGEFEFKAMHDHNRYWQTKDTAFELTPEGLPEIGTNQHRGQVLTVNDSDEAVWATPTVPTASSLAGDGLSASNDALNINYDSNTLEITAGYGLKVKRAVPAPADSHADVDKVLTVVNDNGTDKIQWQTPAGGSLPSTSGASSGDVLTFDGTNVDWAAPSGGGSSAPTEITPTWDGMNSLFTVRVPSNNGIFFVNLPDKGQIPVEVEVIPPTITSGEIFNFTVVIINDWEIGNSHHMYVNDPLMRIRATDDNTQSGNVYGNSTTRFVVLGNGYTMFTTAYSNA